VRGGGLLIVGRKIQTSRGSRYAICPLQRLGFCFGVVTLSAFQQPNDTTDQQDMNQWLANLSPFEVYLIAAPSIMLGSILLVGGIIGLLERRKGNDAEARP
jgi:hypothetical protein